MADDTTDRRVVIAQCKNGLCAGSYAIEDGKLMLHSDFGTHSTMLGLQKSDRLARKLLKHVCDVSSTGLDDPRLLKKRPRSLSQFLVPKD